MSKYNFEINGINLNSTHGKILSQIKKGSKVLECGCASGYMTKFMKEHLNCSVDIIEINEDDFLQAQQYADFAYCGDLSRLKWIYQFEGKQYDVITFADVLEHLNNPLEVLKAASHFLKDDGQIIVSIPNVCHNDILVRMFYDCFTYTDLGLLDNTHIHFFGLRDFIAGCENIGLHVAECDCIGMKQGTTEQRVEGMEIDEDLLKALDKREFGDVYQYVFVCNKIL